MPRQKLDLSKLEVTPSQVKSAEEVVLAKENNSNRKVVAKSLNFYPMPIESVEYNNSFCLCTDNQGILGSVEDCHKIIDALKNLASIICPEELKKYQELIKVCVEKIKTFEDNIAIETYTLYIKAFTLNIVFPTHYGFLRVLDYANSKQLKYSEIKELIKNKKIDLNLNLADASESDIQNVFTDLSNALENISRFFPEIELPFQKRVIIEPPLFTKSNLAKTSTSIVLDAVVAVMVSGKVAKEKIKDKHIYRKNFTIGSINIILDLALEALQQQYGIEDGLESVKVLDALLCHWYKRKNIYGDKISVSGNDILDYLDMKYKNYRGSRCRKYENLGWLLNHCRLLRKIDVCSGIEGINPQNKEPFSIGQETHLIEMNLTTNPIQLNLNGSEDLQSVKDLIIEFKAGDWFKYFDNPEPKGLIQYGYLHRESLSSRGMKSAFLTILPTKLRQTQSGLFKIRTLLEESGYQQKYEEILAESDSKVRATKAKNFKRDFDKAVREIQGIEDPYSISYHHSTPDWVNSRKKKPNDWFNQWLDVTLEIREPKCLTSKETKQLKPVAEKKPKLTVEDLKTAMAENNVSLRPLAKIYGVSFSWLQRRLKGSKFTQTELKDLITQCQILGKKSQS